MSYFADLDLRLRSDGIDPATVTRPLCAHCGEPERIVAYERGRVVFACPAPACIERRRQALAAPEEVQQ